MPSLFRSRHQTLLIRAGVLEKAMGGRRDFDKYLADLQAWNREAPNADPLKRYPIKKDLLEKVVVLTEMDAKRENLYDSTIAFTTENIRAAEDAWKLNTEPFLHITVVAQSALSGLKSAITIAEKDVENRDKKAKAAAAKTVKSTPKKQTAQSSLNRFRPGGSNLLFNLPEISEGCPSPDLDVPSICRTSSRVPVVLGKAPLRLNNLVFKGGFARGALAVESRRMKSCSDLRKELLGAECPLAMGSARTSCPTRCTSQGSNGRLIASVYRRIASDHS